MVKMINTTSDLEDIDTLFDALKVLLNEDAIIAMRTGKLSAKETLAVKRLDLAIRDSPKLSTSITLYKGYEGAPEGIRDGGTLIEKAFFVGSTVKPSEADGIVIIALQVPVGVPALQVADTIYILDRSLKLQLEPNETGTISATILDGLTASGEFYLTKFFNHHHGKGGLFVSGNEVGEAQGSKSKKVKRTPEQEAHRAKVKKIIIGIAAAVVVVGTIGLILAGIQIKKNSPQKDNDVNKGMTKVGNTYYTSPRDAVPRSNEVEAVRQKTRSGIPLTKEERDLHIADIAAQHEADKMDKTMDADLVARRNAARRSGIQPLPFMGEKDEKYETIIDKINRKSPLTDEEMKYHKAKIDSLYERDKNDPATSAEEAKDHDRVRRLAVASAEKTRQDDTKAQKESKAAHEKALAEIRAKIDKEAADQKAADDAQDARDRVYNEARKRARIKKQQLKPPPDPHEEEQREAALKIVRKAEIAHGAMNDAEYTSLFKYGTHRYSDIQCKLRGVQNTYEDGSPKEIDGDTPHWIAGIDSAFVNHGVDAEGVVVHRGTDLDTSRLHVGDVITDKGYISTSASLKFAEDFAEEHNRYTGRTIQHEAVIQRIKTKKGQKVLTTMSDQDEILIDRSTPIKINNIEHCADGICRIDSEVI